MMAGMARNLEPRAMSMHRKAVPAELEKLVGRTLAWKADERPTAIELTSELEHLVETLDDSQCNSPERYLDSDSTSMLPAVKWPG